MFYSEYRIGIYFFILRKEWKLSMVDIFRNRAKFCFLVGIITALVLLAVYQKVEHPQPENYVLGSDPHGYYQYLPTFFLESWENFRHLPWSKPIENGYSISVYTYGVALLQAPFFLIAHGISFLLGYETVGYGLVYYYGVLFSAIFYVCFGLFFLFRVLVSHFGEMTSVNSVMLLFFATNLLYYTLVAPGMSHVYSFFLISFYIWSVPKFYYSPTLRNTLFLSFSISVAILIRPTNVVALLFFFFYGLASRKDILNRFRFFLSNWYLIIMMILVGLLLALPQMLYWHYVTGDWIFYSYLNEGFPYWKTPQIATVLFGARGGWFIYTPLMFFASLVLILNWKRSEFNTLVIIVIMIAIIWINGSWWAPTFSASVGYRALVEYLPFMAFPTGILVEYISNSGKKWLKNLYWSGMVVLVILNIQLMFKYDSTLWWDLPWDWNTFFRLFQF